MARTPQLVITGEPKAYHVISRTALDGFPLGDVEKDFFLSLLKQKARIYFADILGFCIMGNHFHLLARMRAGDDYSDEAIIACYQMIYGKEAVLPDERIGYSREKWSCLSEFVKELKLGFSRYYNKRHNRRGFFWGDRFKSLIVQNGDTLVNCLAYIDLNPIRAGVVERPKEYRWSSIGYHLQSGNQDDLLSLDFGLKPFVKCSDTERLTFYREFLYETGAMDKGKGTRIAEKVVEKERRKGYTVTRSMRFY